MQYKAPSILMDEYWYELPPNRIALFPLPIRDQSKLLVFNSRGSSIEHSEFRELQRFLPEGSLLVMNTSKVVAARLHLNKLTGGVVEVLLTQPYHVDDHPETVLASIEPSEWQCLIGGKNVREGAILKSADKQLTVTVLSKDGPEGVVRLAWESQKPLSEVLKIEGVLPLPPYLKRAAEESDSIRYQTVYAQQEGSVAAPTAGLHFTQDTFDSLSAKNISLAHVVLHVGLGTFRTVSVADIKDHEMHAEQFEISLSELERILECLSGTQPFITAVGTTTVRTLESIHWLGCRLIFKGASPGGTIEIDQWSAFNPEYASVKPDESYRAVVEMLRSNGQDSLWGVTRLIIAPGAKIAVVKALVTNLHHPGNTLLLLVAAFSGKDKWREIYNSALQNGYRFLSYGDSTLMIRT
jgi:S-adenosylmethionine:tRNA ribosyltransferase-isomerase